MIQNTVARKTILVVDDSALNRTLLADILCDRYEVLQAENGIQALEVLLGNKPVSLVLLDIVMPKMDGFELLEHMNRSHLIESVPVIMISSSNTSDVIDRAYGYGVTDFIKRPFVPNMVQHCVANTLMLYERQRKLAEMVAEQIYKREKDGELMISILSHIVEFRNGESGLHIQHIHIITELLLKSLLRREQNVSIRAEDIARISTASALHDIGKISIPEEILNKPGRLTSEEFTVMKGHAPTGAEMLRGLMEQYDSPLLKTGYEICRWHHERYDGRGYPDGLGGDEIPLAAQVVSIADVYDALISDRCYKKGVSHETAMEMIMDGQCGVFNPVLLPCLRDIEGELKTVLKPGSAGGHTPRPTSLTLGKLTSEILSEVRQIGGRITAGTEITPPYWN